MKPGTPPKFVTLDSTVCPLTHHCRRIEVGRRHDVVLPHVHLHLLPQDHCSGDLVVGAVIHQELLGGLEQGVQLLHTAGVGQRRQAGTPGSLGQGVQQQGLVGQAGLGCLLVDRAGGVQGRARVDVCEDNDAILLPA